MASPSTTFPITGPINLVARLGHGHVTVAARDNLTDAVVQLTPRDHQSDALDRMTVELQGSTLVVAGPRQGGWADIIGGWRRTRDSVDAVIEVPSGTPLKISSASETITVTGRCGDADLATSASRITLDTVAGHLRLRYGHGDSHAGTVTGSVDVSAGGGSADFGEVGGSLRGRFGSGEVNAEVIRGDFQGRAGTASARLGAAHGNVDLAFGSGPVQIGLPAGVAAHIDVISGTGQVHTDLPVDEAPTSDAPTTTIRVRTGAGDVRILRAVTV